jgi:hypothetical protein
LWLAQYTSGATSWPDNTYQKWSLHQYSETGEIPGIDDCYVDLDNFNGDSAAFLKWISPTDVAPPQPGPPSERVDIAITAPDDVEVRVSVNGLIVQRHRTRRPVKRGPDLLRPRP